MNAPAVDGRFGFAAILLTAGMGIVGCSKPASNSDPDQAPYAASGGLPPQTGPDRSASPATRLIAPSDPSDMTLVQNPAAANPTGNPPVDSDAGQSDAAGQVSTPFRIQDAEENRKSKVPQRELRADLTVQQLLEFLPAADKDIQTIFAGQSGITDPDEAKETLIQIVKMKLEASRRLSEHAEADADARREGKRGQLQAMSHLATLGDVKVANQLETLAKANLESSDEALVADSRLVLIGFAIESLQNGEKDAADQILDYIGQIARSKSKPDVAAMMMMGEARQKLADYGHDDKARQVRSVIIERFADSPDRVIAQMAAQLAGNVQFDGVDQLLQLAVDGQTVATGRWREALQMLIRESPDVQTVRYLAGAAVELESAGANDLANATYDVLTTQFDDLQSATGREVQLAVAAAAARRDVIGTVMDPTLPGLDGSPIKMADYKGVVVLVPFWASEFPDSLKLIPRLKAIDRAHGDSVAIVGVNLDAAEASLEEFLEANDLGFPSFRATTSPTAAVPNPMAAQFGVVSMPFTAIVDREGRVAAINFTGRDLEETVKRLIGPQ